MIRHLELSLRAWHPNGSSISGEQFVEVLAADASEFSVSGSGAQWEAARIAFGLSLEAFENTKQPHEKFANALRQAFVDFSKWLSGLSPSSFDVLRANGMNFDVFIGVWMDLDQFDFELPPELMRELGRLRLSLKVLSND